MTYLAQPLPARRLPPPHGMATLTVVMVMFFVMAMVAAYTNRNLIFEQRTSANSYRSTQALGAAEAGIDWTVAMINGGSIDAACAGAVGGSSFRARYFNLEYDGSFSHADAWPSCMMTNAGWNCGCPNTGKASLVASGDDAPVVFRVLFEDKPSKYAAKAYPGVVSINVRGCTSALAGQGGNVNDVNACHRTTDAAKVDGQANVRVALGLVSALPVPPVATLTAGGNITLSGGTVMQASNTDPNTAAALHAGGVITKVGSLVASGPPGGSTTDLELQGDSVMQGMASAVDASFFQAFFGMLPQDYQQQPAAVRVTCGGACTASGSVAPMLASNPTRVVWVNGNLNVDQALGTAGTPVMIIVSGTVTFTQPVTVNGVIFSTDNMTWQAGATGGAVIGALVTQADFVADGNAILAYDPEIVRRIRQSYGSFVRVPGSWRIAL